MNSEESRLRTFVNWPDNAVVDSKRIARAGFYYMGQGLEVQCFCCGARISDWNYGDKVMAKHKALDPRCPFVQNPANSGNIPLVYTQRRPLSNIESSSQNDLNSLPISNMESEPQPFLDETTRFNSFVSWPIPKIVAPVKLARSGFYYTQENTKVRCAYCHSVFEDWRPGDDPDLIHQRQFPRCNYVSERIEKGALVNSGSLTFQSDVNNGVSFKDLGIQSHRTPRTPKYSTFESRIRTFNQWPPSLSQTPKDLADAGFFFTGMGDQVRCFHCDGGLRLWQKNDIPWVEHARWFNECGFLLLIKGPEFVEEVMKGCPPTLTEIEEDLVQQPPPTTVNRNRTLSEEQLRDLMNTTVAIAALQVGIEASRVKSAIKQKIETTGIPFDDADSLIVAALDIQTEENSSMDEEYWSTPLNSPAHRVRAVIPRVAVLTSALTDDDSEDDDDQIFIEETTKEQVKPKIKTLTMSEAAQMKPHVNNMSLEEENRRLKEARLCKICMDIEVGVVFLPCGHLVTCANCAHSLKDCPLCRQHIKATVRTFLS